LLAVRVQAKEGLGHVAGSAVLVLLVPAHAAFAVTADAVGIDDKQTAEDLPGSAAEFAQGDLQVFGLGDGVVIEQAMDGDIGSHERETIGQFETALPQTALIA